MKRKSVLRLIMMLCLMVASAALLTSCGPSIKYSNVSNDPYEIFLDGKSLGSLEPHESVTEYPSQGSHTFKAVQLRGYTFFATTVEDTEYLKDSDSKVWFFP